MADKRADTIKLKGNDYAQVAERLKLFWEDNPRGSIDSTYKFQEDGKTLVYETIIVRNAKNPEEGKANGHAMGTIKSDKDFEKFETISVGRALAKLGYLASGEVASLEEMEDYYKHKEEQQAQYIEERIDAIENAKTLEELRVAWSETSKAFDKETVDKLIAAKDKRKDQLENRTKKLDEAKAAIEEHNPKNKVKKQVKEKTNESN